MAEAGMRGRDPTMTPLPPLPLRAAIITRLIFAVRLAAKAEAELDAGTPPPPPPLALFPL